MTMDKALSKNVAAMNLTGMSGEEMAATLVSQGWTWDQVRASYPELFGAGGATIPTGGATGLVPETPETVYLDHRSELHNGDISTGPLSTVAGTLAGMGIPTAGLSAAALGAIAGTGIGTVALAGYGISQAIGVQYPWETGPGEGFIAPWTETVKDESGRWVTRKTRPDLFAGGAEVSLAPASGIGGAVMAGAGPTVVKTWSANGWPFAMTSDGKIHTVTKAGVRKSWRPYRSVVLGKNPSTRQLNGAIRKLAAFDKTHEKIKKLARRLKT